MRRISSVALLVAAALFVVSAVAFAQPRTRTQRRQQARVMQRLVIPQGTEVALSFSQPLSSKTARVGQRVRLRVSRDVIVGNRVVLRAGTPVTAVVSRVRTRRPFGVNADIRLALNPVRSPSGVLIPLQPRTQGAPVGGQKSAEAAGATVGGAAVLGPVGLVGGYFVKGKPVEIKVGDQFDTEVARAVVLRGTQVSRLPVTRRAVAALPTDQTLPPSSQQAAAMPMTPAYQCVPIASAPVAPSVAPYQQPPAGGAQCAPAQTTQAPAPTPSVSAQAQVVPQQCVPAVSAAASTTTVTPPVTVATAPPAPKNFCAGFPDLPTAMDNGYAC